MPELPEVETVRRGLNEWTLGHTIEGGEVLLRRSLAHPSVEAFLQGVTGAAIAHWQRRGKYLLAKLERERAGSWLARGASADDGTTVVAVADRISTKAYARSVILG